jgi:cell division protein FtsB
LKEQIEEFDKEQQRNKAQLHELRRDPATIRKIARERYFMKTDDEDIFVLSDEIPTEENNETTE